MYLVPIFFVLFVCFLNITAGSHICDSAILIYPTLCLDSVQLYLETYTCRVYTCRVYRMKAQY